MGQQEREWPVYVLLECVLKPSLCIGRIGSRENHYAASSAAARADSISGTAAGRYASAVAPRAPSRPARDSAAKGAGHRSAAQAAHAGPLEPRAERCGRQPVDAAVAASAVGDAAAGQRPVGRAPPRGHSKTGHAQPLRRRLLAGGRWRVVCSLSRCLGRSTAASAAFLFVSLPCLPPVRTGVYVIYEIAPTLAPFSFPSQHGIV